MMANGESPPERRSHQRYPVSLPLKYRVIQKRQVVQTGSGTTGNMSSGGVWFRPHSLLSTGATVELTIEWPAGPPHQIGMVLNVQGRVVRAEPRGAAVKIERYSFDPVTLGGNTSPL
jgi:PilZ domain